MGRVHNALRRARQLSESGRAITVSNSFVADRQPLEPAPQSPFDDVSPKASAVTPFPVSEETRMRTMIDAARAVDIGTLKPDPHIAPLRDHSTPAAERFRALAIRVQSLSARRNIKSILVSSARSREGKTTIAAGLAYVLSSPPGTRVLLIDASFGQNGIDRALGVSAPFGLREVLRGEADLGVALIRLEPKGLYVLGSGSSTNHSDLASSEIEEFLSRCEGSFDFVVIDGACLSESAETQRLAVLADATVLIAESAATPHREVAEALKLIPRDRRLGVILNQRRVQRKTPFLDDVVERLTAFFSKNGRAL